MVEEAKEAANDQEPNQLEALREIFEEESRKSYYTGDPRFWRNFEHINIKNVYNANSVEFKNLKLMFIETVFFIFALTILTLFIYEVKHPAVFQCRQEQYKYWSGCDESGHCKLDDVRDMESFWNWTRYEFIPNLYTHDAYAADLADIVSSWDHGFDRTYSPRYVGSAENTIMLGNVQIRQQRVEANKGCSPSARFQHAFADCYGAYNSDTQSTSTFSTRATPKYLLNSYEYQTDDQLKAASVGGYPGGGFAVELGMDEAMTRTTLSDLHAWSWCDRSTRAVVFDLSVLNPNVNVITNNIILCEFFATGAVGCKQFANSARTLVFVPSISRAEELSVFLYQVALLVIFCVMIGWIGWLISKIKFRFFTYGWNYVDFAILILFLTILIIRIGIYTAVAAEPNLAVDVIGHPMKFMPFSRIMDNVLASQQLLAFLGFIVYIKSVKYLSIFRFFRVMVRVIEKCAMEISWFAVLLVLVFFAFALAFFVRFGDQDENFSTVMSSFLVLFFYLISGTTADPTWFDPGTPS